LAKQCKFTKAGNLKNKTVRCFEKEHYAWNKAGKGRVLLRKYDAGSIRLTGNTAGRKRIDLCLFTISWPRSCVVVFDEKFKVFPHLFDMESEVVINKGCFKELNGRFLHSDYDSRVAIWLGGIGYSVVLNVRPDEAEPARTIPTLDCEGTVDLTSLSCHR
jgi:hypothetical protein